MAGRRVLLFGASGFLGTQVGAALDRDPRAGRVIRVRRQRTDQLGTGWISHDLAAGADELAAVIRSVRPDVVVNCAGRLSGDTVQLVEANVLVTARMIEAVAREAPAARLVVLGGGVRADAVWRCRGRGPPSRPNRPLRRNPAGQHAAGPARR